MLNEKPAASFRNILLIVVDQWRGDTLGVLGHPAARTPNVDALARDGVLFRRHYCQGTPCGPARASLHTGLYVLNHRVVTNGVPFDARHTHLALELRRGGHDPVLVGYTTTTPDPRCAAPSDPRYRQLGDNLDGWRLHAHFDEDRFRNYLAWAAGRGFPIRSGSVREAWLPASGRRAPSPEPAAVPSELSDTSWATDRALEYLRSARGRPWVLHLGYYRPHPPLIAPAPFHAAIDEASIPPPVRAADPEQEAAQHPMLRHFLQTVRRKKCFLDGEELMTTLSDDEVRLARKAYLGLIAEVDAGIGSVIRYLKETEQYGDTLIVFTSDHAEQLGDHFLFSKMGYFDQSYHVPLIIRCPRTDADGTRGASIEEFTESVDLLPTILEWTGLPVPRQCDGRSLLPFIRGASPAGWRQEVHYEFDLRSGYPDPGKPVLGLGFDEGGLAVLQDRQYKYVHCTALPPALYDLTRDPPQMVNCAGDPAYVSVLAEYAQRMLTWRARHAERTLTHLSATPNGLVDRRDLLPASAVDGRRAFQAAQR